MLAEERLTEPEEALRAVLDGRQATIWTALPGIIDSFNASKLTAVVQPTIQYQYRDPTGMIKPVTLPQCLDVPVQFIGGGGNVLTFQPSEGDECLLVFAQRCIDAWWQSGGVQPQAEFRMHDPSDGFCIPGFYSVPRVFADLLATGAELRSADRARRITLLNSGAIEMVNPNGSLILGADGSVTMSNGSGSLSLHANGNTYVVGTLYVNGVPVTVP